MLRKFLCFIGWHHFSWSITELGWGENGLPPKMAKCIYCGVTFGKDKRKGK